MAKSKSFSPKPMSFTSIQFLGCLSFYQKYPDIATSCSYQFRLYFLSKGSKAPHEIHLAKLEGYDLDRPIGFFDKYGSFVLALMQMVKFRITMTGAIVPPLAHFKVAEGLEAVENQFKFVREGFEPLVDDMITFIEDEQKNGVVSAGPGQGPRPCYFVPNRHNKTSGSYGGA
ncbi:hypothetical protein BC939DRAFT_477968 [Gamsiella multidivaricata]|uniref:uncharacterized protein n=1 Tax=Gamsiella multidivaricata TaxID=101098 RepID=UPI00222038B2|nr:uncharacterized protein BC939DRAFT_477968 [Gamsiella multidivaricata]KAI7821973.1 hypothetical protein BC939DRAFT_477968 [Gamsiella multidivaricata]